jgi:hypothetical protein
VIFGFVGCVRKIARGESAVSGGDGTIAVQSFKILSSVGWSGPNLFVSVDPISSGVGW